MGLAVISFVLALFYGWMGFRHGGFISKIGDKSVILADRLLHFAAAALWFFVGFQRVWVSPRDRVLLLLADDMLAQYKETNQALGSTPASVTPAADAPDAGAAHL